MFLGDSLCALRTYDVLRAIEMLAYYPGLGGGISLYSEGKHGVYAKLAYALSDRLTGIDEKDVFPGFASWVSQRFYNRRAMPEIILPGILDRFDLNDIIEMAKVKL